MRNRIPLEKIAGTVIVNPELILNMKKSPLSADLKSRLINFIDRASELEGGLYIVENLARTSKDGVFPVTFQNSSMDNLNKYVDLSSGNDANLDVISKIKPVYLHANFSSTDSTDKVSLSELNSDIVRESLSDLNIQNGSYVLLAGSMMHNAGLVIDYIREQKGKIIALSPHIQSLNNASITSKEGDSKLFYVNNVDNRLESTPVIGSRQTINHFLRQYSLRHNRKNK